MVKIGRFSHWIFLTFWRVLACLLLQLIEVSEVKSHPQQGRLHDSLIAKLSHIGSTPILQFFFAFSSCFTQDGYQMPLASLQQLLEYIQRFLHGLALLYFHMSDYAELKKEEINIWAMKTQQAPNKWQYLTCNQSIIFKPKLPKMI